MNNKILIIDPASTEFNRGSFCYLPYIFYSYLKSEGYDVELIENFTVADIDNLPPHKTAYVSLWSYPQLDTCFVLNRFLNVSFFGYYPLIKHYSLPEYKINNQDIYHGLIFYPLYMEDFKYVLLSDCDMHLKKYEGQVYPMFTSYGCPKGCAFCPSTVNCKERIVLDPSVVETNLRTFYEKGYRNVHFTDEDFFFDIDRTYLLLRYISIKLPGMKLIALGSTETVLKYLNKYGRTVLIESGMKIIEVGFETANDELAKKMGKGFSHLCGELAEKMPSGIDIFWLTLTFFPGETLNTLNETGQFLRKYGFKYGELFDRVATNGCEGGLGQFFQPYHGTKGYEDLKEKGIFLSDRPIRLLPSYLPNSFLYEGMKRNREIETEDEKWFDLYKVEVLTDFPSLLEENFLVGTMTEGSRYSEMFSIDKLAIFYAICARLGIISNK